MGHAAHPNRIPFTASARMPRLGDDVTARDREMFPEEVAFDDIVQRLCQKRADRYLSRAFLATESEAAIGSNHELVVEPSHLAFPRPISPLRLVSCEGCVLVIAPGLHIVSTRWNHSALKSLKQFPVRLLAFSHIPIGRVGGQRDA